MCHLYLSIYLAPLMRFIVPGKAVAKSSPDIDDSETESDTEPEEELNETHVSRCRRALSHSNR